MGDLRGQILAIVRSVWRRRWYIVAIAWTMCLVGWGIVMALPDRFESKTRIYVDTQTLLAPLLSGIAVASNLDQQVAFMQRTLLSRPNLSQVVRMADLDLTVTNEREMEALLDRLSLEIEIRSQGKDLFTIAYSDSDPRLAQRVVQSLVNIFVEDNLGQNRSEMEKARSFLESQIAQYERQLRDSEKKLAEFKAANLEFTSAGMSFLQRVESTRNAYQKELQEFNDVQATRDRMQQQLETIPQFIPTDSQPQVVINNDRVLSSEEDLTQRIREVERTLDVLLGRYTDSHPDVKSTRRTLAKLNKQLDEEAILTVETKKRSADEAADVQANGPKKLVPNQVYETLKLRLLDIEAFISTKERRLKAAQVAVSAAEEQAVTAPAVEARLADLNRDYVVIKNNYEQLLARRESAKIAQAVDAETDIQFRIVDPPRVPTIPTGPNRPLFSSIVLLVAIGSGVAFAYLLTQMDVAFTSIASLRSAFSLPIIGAASNIVVKRYRGLRFFEVTGYIAMYGIMLALYVGVLKYSDEISRGLRSLGLEKLL